MFKAFVVVKAEIERPVLHDIWVKIEQTEEAERWNKQARDYQTSNQQ